MEPKPSGTDISAQTVCTTAQRPVKSYKEEKVHPEREVCERAQDYLHIFNTEAFNERVCYCKGYAGEPVSCYSTSGRAYYSDRPAAGYYATAKVHPDPNRTIRRPISTGKRTRNATKHAAVSHGFLDSWLPGFLASWLPGFLAVHLHNCEYDRSNVYDMSIRKKGKNHSTPASPYHGGHRPNGQRADQDYHVGGRTPRQGTRGIGQTTHAIAAPATNPNRPRCVGDWRLATNVVRGVQLWV